MFRRIKLWLPHFFIGSDDYTAYGFS
jgi:hypothetical protein